MAPNINNPGGVKNDPDEIRDAVVSDATRFPGGFIDQQITQAGAAVAFKASFNLSSSDFVEDFDTSTQTVGPEGMTVSPDGSRIYVADERSGDILQYDLATPFDITTISFDVAFDASAQDTEPLGVLLADSGTRLYTAGNSSDSIHQYDLSTAFDVSTATFNQSLDVSTQDARPSDVAISEGGDRLYVAGNGGNDINQFSLSTSFDVSTGSFSTSFDVSPQTTSPGGVTFRPDGSEMYVAGGSTQTIFSYILSTDFDISTANFDDSLDISPQNLNGNSVVFSPDGSRLYVSDGTFNRVAEYSIGILVKDLS